jgi:hypothetical protein
MRRPRSGYLVALLVLGVGAVCAVVGPAVYRHREDIAKALRRDPEPAAGPVSSAPPAPVEVSSDRLQADYAANEVAADQRYRGRVLRVTGAVRAIRQVFNSPYLELWTTSEFNNVDAMFDRSWADRLARVKVGDHVAVRCVGAGMAISSPWLESCSLE